MSQPVTTITFRHNGMSYQILGHPDGRWGEFTVYRGDEQVARFDLMESRLRSELRSTGLPPDVDLIALAREGLDSETRTS